MRLNAISMPFLNAGDFFDEDMAGYDEPEMDKQRAYWQLKKLAQTYPVAAKALQRLKNSHDTRINYLLTTNQITKDKIMAPKGNRNKTENNFYVGAPWLLNDKRGYVSSFNDAVEQAKAKLEQTGQPQTIVQIVAVVENVKPPVRVRKVE